MSKNLLLHINCSFLKHFSDLLKKKNKNRIELFCRKSTDMISRFLYYLFFYFSIIFNSILFFCICQKDQMQYDLFFFFDFGSLFLGSLGFFFDFCTLWYLCMNVLVLLQKYWKKDIWSLVNFLLRLYKSAFFLHRKQQQSFISLY